MWKEHACLSVILAFAVSSLSAAENQQNKSLVNCPKYSVVSSVKTSPPKSKAPVFKKQNTPARFVSATKTNGGIKLDSITEVSSDITTNQIWTAGNTYHVANDISVQALLVIEPGTTVTFASGTTMAVDNGGALISAGTPDNPIIYTSDSATPNYGDYNCPIYIRETASTSTKVTYSYIEYANIGISTLNKRLDCPIENNYLYSNVFGIVGSGIDLTDIQNNLIVGTYYYGIEVFFASDSGLADSSSNILIQNNTCDYYQDVGIIVFGVENPDQAGHVNLVNNIVSGAYQYGLVLANGYMYYTIDSTGYYANEADTYDNYDQTNPVIETINPYVTGTGILPDNYLNHNSAFVNASDEYIEQTQLIGKTTDINSFPDSNKADLGFHYPNWNYSNAGASNLTADFDSSYTVDFNDLSEFADYWLYDYNDNYNCWSWDFDNSGLVDLADFEVIAEYWLTSFDFVDFADFARYWRREVDYKFQDKRFDLNGDTIVNFKDFAMFADQWRQTTQSTDPNIQIQISGNPNNGLIDISASGYSPNTQCIFLLADGKYIGEVFDFRDGYTLTMDISGFGNGEHQLKAVSVDSNSHITCSNIKAVTFSNPFSYCSLSEHYVQNQPLYFAGFYNGTGNVSINVYANGENLVWSQPFSGNNIFSAIPATITNQYDFDYVSFTEVSSSSSASGLRASGSAGGGASVIIITDPVEPPISGIQALIILPDPPGFDRIDIRQIKAIQTAFRNKGIQYRKLRGSSANYDTVALYATTNPVKYIYIDTHGNYRINGVLRTVIDLSDGHVVSMKQSDFAPGQAPSWCTSLGSFWEPRVKSFFSMGFYYVEFAYFDACYSGRLYINANNQLVEGQPGQQGLFDLLHSDMSIALGMGETSKSRFYQGWWGPVPIGSPPPSSEDEYQTWTHFEWQKLGEGEDLYQAIYDVIMQQTDFGSSAPVNNYRLKGQGWLEDIILNNY